MTPISIGIVEINIWESGVVTVLYSDQSTYEWPTLNDYYEWCSQPELQSAFETLKYKIASAWVLANGEDAVASFDLSMNSESIVTGA